VIQQGGGVAVTDVSPDGPAFQRLSSVDDQGGPDVIVQVNGTPTRNRAEFHAALAKVKPGNIVTLQILSQDPSSSTGWTGRVVRLRAR
jgi:S1-C subfamily serine protease